MTTRHDHADAALLVLTQRLRDLAWNMPAERQQELKDHLITEIRRAEPARSAAPGSRPVASPRRRARLILAAGTAMAGMATVVAVIGISSQNVAPSANRDAIQLLAKVAYAASRQPAVKVRDNQYMYAETKEASVSLPGNLEPFLSKGSLPRRVRLGLERLRPQMTTERIWMPVADVCRVGLEHIVPAKGPAYNWKFSAGGPGTKCPSIGGLNDASYRLLETLPTDPPALLAMIYKVEAGHGPSPGQEAFVTIGDLLRDKIAPPNVAAALYRAAALIPGVTLVPNATDAAGRHGVAVAQTANGIRTELIFNRTSLRLIGERTILVRIGVSTNATAIIRQAFVNHLGQIPPPEASPGPQASA